MLKRRVLRPAVFLAVCCCSSSLTGSSAAQSESREPTQSDSRPASQKAEAEEEKELLNAFSFGGAYAFQLDRDRDSATTGEPLRTRENLGGRSVLASGSRAKIVVTGSQQPATVEDLGAQIESEVEWVEEVDLRFFPSRD